MKSAAKIRKPRSSTPPPESYDSMIDVLWASCSTEPVTDPAKSLHVCEQLHYRITMDRDRKWREAAERAKLTGEMVADRIAEIRKLMADKGDI